MVPRMARSVGGDPSTETRGALLPRDESIDGRILASASRSVPSLPSRVSSWLVTTVADEPLSVRGVIPGPGAQPAASAAKASRVVVWRANSMVPFRMIEGSKVGLQGDAPLSWP